MVNRVAVAVLAAALAATVAAGEGKEAARLKDAAEVLNEIMGAPDDAIPGDLLARAECVAAIPSVTKLALGFSGRVGRGAVSCRRGETMGGAWGPPSMISIGGGGFGLQIGGTASDVVLLVMNKKGAEHLLRSKFTLGGDAAAAAGPKGRSAAVATDATMNAEILTYARSRGLFAGVSLEGASLRPDNDANKAIYGKKVEARDLLLEGKHGTPAAAQVFIAALQKHAPKNVSAKVNK